MFTGLVQDVGKIIASDVQSRSMRLTFFSHLPANKFLLGASIACNGACLTVVEFSEHASGTCFSVELGPQTLALTRFARLATGTLVNLELALRVGDALGGHEVSGHLDALCRVNEITEQCDGFWKLCVGIDPIQRKWIVPKGSIAVAGVSLTIAQLRASDEGWGKSEFEIMLVPHTIKNTALCTLRAGEQVEVEFDQKVKAIASLLEIMLPEMVLKN